MNTAWWMVDIYAYLSNVPDRSWGLAYTRRGFSLESHWPMMEQQWADSIGLGINAASKRGRGRRG